MIQYKSVPGPVGITINRKEDYATAVKQYASIIDSESVGGWKFEFIRKIPVTKKAGCLASLFGQENTTLYMNMLVFSKDDAGDITLNAQTNGEINGPISQMGSEETNIGTVETGNIAQNTVSSFEVSIPRGVIPEIPGSTYDEGTTASNVDKKKLAVFAGGAIVAALIIGILISSCNNPKPAPYDGPSDSAIEYLDEDEISAGAKAFCKMAEGTWVSTESITPLNDEINEVYFEYVRFVDGEWYWAVYCGDGVDAGQVIDANEISKNTYDVTTYYPEIPNNFINGPRDAYYSEFTMEIWDDELTVYHDSCSEHYIYMGYDEIEAEENASDYYYQNLAYNDYLLPTSDSEYLTDKDLEDLSWEELCFARNEIFARHGRIFKTEEIQEYFEGKDWYEGTIEGKYFDSHTGKFLNSYEKANVDYIAEYEHEHFGGSYY